MGLETVTTVLGEEIGLGAACCARAARLEERESPSAAALALGMGGGARRGSVHRAGARGPKEGFTRRLVEGRPGAGLKPSFPSVEGREVLGDGATSEDAVSHFLPPSEKWRVRYNNTSLALKAQGLHE